MKSARLMGGRDETSLRSSGAGRFDPVLFSGFSGSCNVMVECVFGLCEGCGVPTSCCIPGIFVMPGCCSFGFCCGDGFCFSAGVHPGMFMPSMHGTDCCWLPGAPVACAGACRPKRPIRFNTARILNLMVFLLRLRRVPKWTRKDRWDGLRSSYARRCRRIVPVEAREGTSSCLA